MIKEQTMWEEGHEPEDGATNNNLIYLSINRCDIRQNNMSISASHSVLSCVVQFK
jgi:hypothetical protein